MTKAEYAAEQRRLKALIKELRWHRHHTRAGHRFKGRHTDRHRGCRKDSY